MKLYPRFSVIIPAAILALVMLRLSWWQYDRYQEKLIFVEELQRRLAEPVTPLTDLLSHPTKSLPFRRVTVTGTYDFTHEVVLRNRRHDGIPGVLVLTPLAITVPERTEPLRVLVSRGFIPLSRSSQEQRTSFQRPTNTHITAIIKETAERRFLAPNDPPSGPQHPWVDAWLRVDLPRIGAQLPYPLLPFYLEEIPANQVDTLSLSIVQSHSDREEMLSMASRRPVAGPPNLAAYTFPIPSPTTVVPAGRHRQYVYEWLILAVLTVLGSLILMLRPQRMV